LINPAIPSYVYANNHYAGFAPATIRKLVRLVEAKQSESLEHRARCWAACPLLDCLKVEEASLHPTGSSPQDYVNPEAVSLHPSSVRSVISLNNHSADAGAHAGSDASFVLR
jgi:hypothetical protein